MIEFTSLSQGDRDHLRESKIFSLPEFIQRRKVHWRGFMAEGYVGCRQCERIDKQLYAEGIMPYLFQGAVEHSQAAHGFGWIRGIKDGCTEH